MPLRRWSPFTGLALLVLIGAAAPPPAGAREALEILPPEVRLHGPAARQRLLVHRWTDQGRGDQLTEPIEWISSDTSVCQVIAGVVRPLRNGQATVTARIDEVETSVPVHVIGMEEPVQWSFRHDVLPVMSKVGCNSGSCHGALAGKGGFRLSLRAYDPESDYHNITRQSGGRRIELLDPGRSLILCKPTGALPHRGGVRFDIDSLEYQVLSQWIAAGAPGPAPADPQLESLEVYPDAATLSIGQEQQLVVLAHYSGGVTRDVTRWVRWASADETVARVDDHGRVEIIGNGEGALTAWFSSQIAIARVTSPYENDVSPVVYAEAPSRNFIDDIGLQQLQRLRLPPSGRCTDSEFIRRVFLDCIGTLPTADEVRVFLADETPDKRDRLIDALLARPEFVDYWTYRWSDVLLINGNLLRPESVRTYYLWLRGHVEANTHWDDLVREVLTAQGSTHENGATNFYALHQDPESLSENASQAFLGLSIACARCHNHPLEKWTNDQYYSMASLFARVRGKGWGGDARNGDGLRTIYVVDKGELLQPRTGLPRPPAPLDGEELPFESTEDRRVHLANWMTSPDNPYFARSIANRVWGNYLGIGLVDQVDDMRVSNPASNEALLTALADYLVEHDFDLKKLMQAIMVSETYQRSSEPSAGNVDDRRFYSRYYPRRLMAEVLLDAISQVSDVPSHFTEIVFSGADRVSTDFYPVGTRAIQLYDSAVQSYFLKTFGRNQREITCECERSNEPSMIQVLHLSNGLTINEKLAAAENRVTELLQTEMDDAAIVTEVYLWALSRMPTEVELSGLVDAMQDDSVDRRVLVEDLFWGVMSSREFLFNH